jgi:hypothetical protein
MMVEEQGLSPAVAPDRRIHWRCFHCGETFTKAQRRWALQHFGADQGALPACQMRVPGEHHLLEYLRKAEAELDAYRQEDTELHRAIHAMASDHDRAIRRAEEDGYNKGLRDAISQTPDLSTPSDNGEGEK